ncbi:acyltransferase domain-containing protein [Nonomuraea sp. K274]|uniref:Acyltransferase domain-containing protein n=1 Tax=Nonomuraea cypriaca TaxID=1187855 RepID=A0A931ABH7_9ACTN|nr:type I polyketide synthase [Nonomuraea cypriaca]MBF8187064.1 acyltransferase domain-containing protein [Nonomuraea cypriaca]
MDAAKTEFGELSVAIVGMTCRVADADGVEQFWTNLCAGVESVRDLTDEELLAADVPRSVFARPDYVRAASVIEGEDLFDAEYFGFGPREAAVMDPQHRVFLEAAATVLQHAGYQPNAGTGSVGVFAACGINQYIVNNVRPHTEIGDALGETQINIGNDADYLATRVAHKLDLQGPALTVQTACSSSLVAVHLAVQALLSGDCDLAIAGGVSIRSPQRVGHRASEANIGTADGHCRPFDSRASGTLTGNGVGVVLLKRATEAIADGDIIHAVIQGSAINNDGANKVGYTAPSVTGQSRVIRASMAAAGVQPRSIGYVEAHGTATRLGDPIEVTALVDAYGRGVARPWCALASVKGNLGHLDAAAGVVGLIKAALAVEHGVIPPSLHFVQPNPELPLAGSPFFVPTEPTPWRIAGVRRAAVSSFGIGGTNAHMVVCQPPARRPGVEVAGPRTLLLSGRDQDAIVRVATRLDEFLAGDPTVNLADAEYTLQIGRPALAHRAVVVCRDVAEARAELNAVATASSRRVAAARRRLGWLLPGQGSQFPGMAGGLYRTDEEFRAVIDLGAAAVRAHVGLDVMPAFAGAIAPTDLADTRIVQPALFLVEYALADLLRRRGVPRDAMLGHSLGDFVAGCNAGVFPYPDAAVLVAERGRIMAECPPGTMLAVDADADRIADLSPDDVVIAAVNAPGTCVVAGRHDAVAGLAARLESTGIGAKALHTSHAFHSPLMDDAVSRFRRVIDGVRLAPPTEPMVSSMTGTWLSDAEATDPDFWARQLRRPVLFGTGLTALAERGINAFVEVGPGRALTQPVRLTVPDAPLVWLLPSREVDRDDERAIAEAIGRLWAIGVDIDWSATRRGRTPRRIILPTYPFARTRHWLTAPERAASPVSRAVRRVVWLPERAVASAPPDAVLVYPPADGGALLSALGEVVDEVRVARAGEVAATVIYCLAHGVPQLATLINAMSTMDTTHRLVVLANVHALESQDRISDAAPTIRALVAQAPPNVSARIVDVPADLLRADPRRIAAECVSAESCPVALRGGRRLRRREIVIEATASRSPGAWSLLAAAPDRVAERVRQVLPEADGSEVAGVVWVPALDSLRIDEWRAVLRTTATDASIARAVLLAPDGSAESGSAEAIAALVEELRADGPSWTVVHCAPGGPSDADWLGEVELGVETIVVPGDPATTDDVTPAADETAAPTVRDRLAGIWRLMLGVSEIDGSADFYQLGGHSLLATRITARVRQEFGADIPMNELFSSMSTLDAMAACVTRHLSDDVTSAGAVPELRAGEPGESAPLAPVQQSMWFLQQVDPNSVAYLLANNVGLTGALDVPALRRAMSRLVRRHDLLLSAFALRDRRPSIVPIAEDIAFPLVNLSGLDPDVAMVQLRRWRQHNATTPIEIATAPPLRAILVRLAPDRHELLLGLHHLAGDYWSSAILLDELLKLYQAEVEDDDAAVAALSFSYRDYARWQQGLLDGGWQDGQIDYWRSRLNPLPEPMVLPTTAAGGDRFRGESVHLEIPSRVRTLVESVGRASGTTPFMVFHAALVMLLRDLTGRDDICVGTFVANRPHPELEKLIGLFANTVVLRIDAGGDPTFGELLARVKTACTEAFSHADVPFDRVVKAVGVPRQWGSNPLFRVMLVAETAPPPGLSTPLLEVSVDAEPSPTAKNDLLFVVYPEGDRLMLQLEFATGLFDRETARSWADRLISLVTRGAEDMGRHVGELTLGAMAAE